MSALEDEFAFQLLAYKMPEYESEYRFCERRWRFDFAFVDQKVAVEIEGGTWTGGRHTTGKGFEADTVKYNTAQSLGWAVYRFTGKAVRDGSAIAMMRMVLNGG